MEIPFLSRLPVTGLSVSGLLMSVLYVWIIHIWINKGSTLYTCADRPHLFVHSLHAEYLLCFVILVVYVDEYLKDASVHVRSELHADALGFSGVQLQPRVLELEHLRVVCVYEEHAALLVRVRVRDALVATPAATYWQLQLERLLDVRRFRRRTDEPGAEELVRLHIDDVHVEELAAAPERANGRRDLVNGVRGEHERVPWLQPHLQWMRRKTLHETCCLRPPGGGKVKQC